MNKFKKFIIIFCASSIINLNSMCPDFLTLSTNSPYIGFPAINKFVFSQQITNGNVFGFATSPSNLFMNVYGLDILTGDLSIIKTIFLLDPPSDVAASPEFPSGSLIAAMSTSFAANQLIVLEIPPSGNPISRPSVPTGNGASSVSFSPLLSTGNVFAAVTNSTDNTVSVYNVDQIGTFTPVAGSPFLTGSNPQSVAFSTSASGNVYAAVTNASSNNISVYSVDSNTGVFTPVGTFPVTGINPGEINFSPAMVNGNFIAGVVLNSSNQVQLFNVNSTTGQFTPISLVGTGSAPNSIAFINQLINGNIFFGVTNSGSDNTSVFEFNTSTSTVTPTTGSPFAVSAGSSSPAGLSFTSVLSNGNLFAGVANSGSGNIDTYLAALPPAPPIITSASSDCAGVVQVIGTGIANATITIFDENSTQVSSGVIDGSGNFNISTSPFSNGSHSITATQTVGGCPSSPSAPTAITVTTTPAAPNLLSAASSSSGIVNVAGTSQQSAIIALYADNIQIGSGQSNSAGNFNFNSSSALAAGSHSITVTQTINSCSSAHSNAITVVIAANICIITNNPLTLAIRQKYGS